VQVSEKHWVYPPEGEGRFTLPVEVAYGPLVTSAGAFGCDLRPSASIASKRNWRTASARAP
jgi:hypothetical protein